jgi:phage terminase small subunit
VIARTKGAHIGTRRRVQPFSKLAAGPAKVFAHIVRSVDQSHFSEVDLPLLEAYANSAHLAAQAAEEIEQSGAVVAGKASPWLAVQEKAAKSLVALSARLRICPQSRFDRLVAGSNSRPQIRGRKPWECDGLLAGEDEDDPADKFFRTSRST